MEEKQIKKSNSKGLYVIIAILLIAVIGMGLFIAYDKGIIFKRGGNTTSEKETDNKKEDIEEEVTENAIINDLVSKIEKITVAESTDYNIDYSMVNNYVAYGFRWKVLKETLTDADKQEIALSNTKWERITGDFWKNSSSMKSYIEAQINSGIPESSAYQANKQVTEDKVNDVNINLFGSKITNPVEQVGLCPIYFYERNSKMYFRPEPQCGGVSGNFITRKIKKVTQYKDKRYVYVNYAYAVPDGQKFNIYGDINIKKLDLNYSEVEEMNKIGEIEIPQGFTVDTYKLDDSIIDKSSVYKFVFEKDSTGNYYFTKVEQQ